MQVPEQGVAYGFGLRADAPKPEGFRARSPNPEPYCWGFRVGVGAGPCATSWFLYMCL